MCYSLNNLFKKSVHMYDDPPTIASKDEQTEQKLQRRTITNWTSTAELWCFVVATFCTSNVNHIEAPHQTDTWNRRPDGFCAGKVLSRFRHCKSSYPAGYHWKESPLPLHRTEICTRDSRQRTNEGSESVDWWDRNKLDDWLDCWWCSVQQKSESHVFLPH